MANMILNSARFILFGTKLDAKVSLENVAKRKAANVGRKVLGLPAQSGPGLRDWLWQVVKDEFNALFGTGNQGPRLPDDMPVAMFNCIDSVLRNRGGMANRELNLPNFWLNTQGATSTPFFWSMVVDYSPTADITRVAGFEMALEDAMTRAGFDYNVRIQQKPIRIEVDKPKPPTVNLTDLWPQVAAFKTNQRKALLGITFLGGKVVTLNVDLTGEDFSAFIAGSPGSGKTQLSMAMILSLAMSNSPASMSMIIIDPKAIDWRPYNRLPHLAMPVVNEAVTACETLQALCDEMDSRTRRAARGDTSFLAHSILVYIDELSDLFASLPEKEGEQLAVNIQRLGQKGRGVGFIVIGATQRVFDVPAKAHSKLNMRIVGKMKNAGDSVSASGVAGSTTNKLPGRGSFELHSSAYSGLRIQAPFVAASDKPGYEKALQPFFDAIAARWQGSKPAWTPPGAAPAPSNTTTQAPAPEPKQSVPGTPAEPQMDPALVDSLLAAYRYTQREQKEFSVSLVRQLHKLLYGAEANHNKAKRIRDEFLNTYATNNAEL